MAKAALTTGVQILERLTPQLLKQGGPATLASHQLKELGRGVGGIVFQGPTPNTCVKFMHRTINPRELAILKQLNQLVAEYPESFAFEMKRHPGVPVDECLKTAMDDKTILQIMCSIVEKLEILHKEKIVHFDVKDSNLLIFNSTAEFIDFGASIREEDSTTMFQKGKDMDCKDIGRILMKFLELIKDEGIKCQIKSVLLSFQADYRGASPMESLPKDAPRMSLQDLKSEINQFRRVE